MKKIELDLKVDAALNELSAQIRALPRVKDGKIYEVPAAIKKKAVRIFHESGISVSELAQRLGMSGSSIHTWIAQRKKIKKKRRKSNLREKKISFTRVKVVPEAKRMAPEALTLELAGGAKVHGLSLIAIRELVGMDGGVR